jgi:beta-lactamase regulating signal transducer with metallopeptidase domain
MSSLNHVVGWALIHFVWQGAVLAVVAAGALWLCRHQSANARYTIACGFLAAMLAMPVISMRVLMASDLTQPSVAAVPTVIAAPTIASTATHSWFNDGAFSVDAAWADLDAVLPVIVVAWLAGIAILLVRMAGGLWHVRRLQVRTLAADASRWHTAANQIASRLGLRFTVHVVESALVDTPATLGWLRPVILLPIAALANLTPSQVEAILAHELIHIRRHDYLVNVAQSVAETLLFFHPGVWWVSGRVRIEREHCCDDGVVQVCGDAEDYAAALAELEAWRWRGTTLALAATHGPLIGRVRRILRAPIGHEARSLSWVVTLGLTFVLATAIGAVYVSSLGVPVLMASAQGSEPIASPDSFDWQVRRTDHFDIYYYPALAPTLDHVADIAERAYKSISSDLPYNLAFRVPLVLFKTRSDFAQQSIAPEARGAIVRGDVTAFSEPERDRIVMLTDAEPGRLSRQMTHELSHIFAFEIIPRSQSNVGRVAQWIDEGFAEYMTGSWEPNGVTEVHDVVAADRIPKITALIARTDHQSDVIAANLGHAVFEFIETEYGKAAVWQFLLEVRRNIVDGAANPYQATFNRTPEEFDAAFANYLQRRFRQ